MILIPMHYDFINREVELINLTKKGKNVIVNKGSVWNLKCYCPKVACLKDEPGFLLTLEDDTWQGMWIKANNDKEFDINLLEY